MTGDKKGAWAYGDRGNGDNSNAQFALLALHEAERVGVKISDRTWKLALNYWLGTQKADGSWGYYEGAPSTGSMTCAGIASVAIAAGRLHEGDASVTGESGELLRTKTTSRNRCPASIGASVGSGRNLSSWWESGRH